MDKIFEYDGCPVTFSMGDGKTMINATEMARPFGKRPNDYLNLTSTKELISAITRKNGIAENQLVITRRGGNDVSQIGTWMQEDLALDFAQWLSIDFRLWCNDRIKELLTQGHTEIAQHLPTDYLSALEQLVEKEKQRLQLEEQKQLLQTVIKTQADDVRFSKAMQICEGGVYMKQLATVLTQNGITIGQNRLFALLRERGFLCERRGFKNSPVQKYLEQGLFEIKNSMYTDKNGVGHQTQTTMVTGKGQKFFINLFLDKEKA